MRTVPPGDGSADDPVDMMKRSLLALTLGLWAGIAPARAAQDFVNGLTVIVGDDVITYQDVIDLVAPTVQVLRSQYANRPEEYLARLEEVRKEALEQLVERKLILHEFENAGYGLPESVIDDEVRRRVREAFGPDRGDLTRTLQARGMTFETFREQIREDFIVSAMRQFKMSEEKVVISPYKIEKYYADNLDDFRVGDEYKLRSIMISSDRHESIAVAEQLAQEILKQLDEGASFAAMARIYSDESNRAESGERGWVELEKSGYNENLIQAIKVLAPGQHTPVIETWSESAGFAYWIMFLDDVKRNHIKTLSEVRAEIEQKLRSEELDRRRKQWIERLKQKAFVQYF